MTIQSDLNEVVSLLADAPEFVAVDTETNGLHAYKGDRLIGISFYFPHVDKSFYLPFRHGLGDNLPLYSMGLLRDVWDLPETYVMFNAKFDLHMLHADGFITPTNVLDTMIAAHLVNENEDITNGSLKPDDNGNLTWTPQRKGAYQLKRLARIYLGPEAGKGEDELIEAAKQLGLNPKSEMWKLPHEIVAPYAKQDAEITYKLLQFYIPHLERWQNLRLFYDRCDFQLHSLFRMERNGMLISRERLQQAIEDTEPKIELLQKELNELAIIAGMPGLNVRSPLQVKNFFKQHGYEIASTDKKSLERMDYGENEAANKILELRDLSNQISKFYEPYRELLGSDNRLHPSFNVIGTVTGRISSYDPNMQQVPRTGTSDVKKIFTVPEGYTLFQADYKQLELRIAACYAKCGQMIQMFKDGVDMHQVTADNLTELTGHKVSRSLGKATNFGLIYGMGGRRFAYEHNIPVDQATDIVNSWNSMYPEFRQASANAQAIASQDRDEQGNPGGKYNYIRLYNNYTRRFHLYKKYNVYGRGVEAVKDAWNAVVQGTASFVNETSILRICNAFINNDTFKPLLTVHDSFVFMVKDHAVAYAVAEVKEIMEDWDHMFNPPLRVDLEYSKSSWGELKKWE